MRYRFVTTPDGRHTLVFDATGGLVRVMPVFAGGAPDDPAPSDPAPSDPPSDPAPTDPAPEDPEDPADPEDDDDKPVSRREHRKRGKENQKLKQELQELKNGDTEFKKGLAKLLGIEPDDESPEALKKAMADAQKTVGEKDTTIAEQSKEITSLKVQIAVGDAARKEGADDSLTYAYLNAHGKLSTLDPEADDFDTKVSGLVQDAVKEKEVLRTRQVPGRSGSDLNGGGSSGDQAKSLEGAIAARYKS